MKDRFTCFYKSWIRRNAPPRLPHRVKFRGTKEYAGVVELADTYDLGTVTSVKVFHSVTRTKIKYAGMLESVDWTDLGAVTLLKVFSSMPQAKIKAGSPVL